MSKRTFAEIAARSLGIPVAEETLESSAARGFESGRHTVLAIIGANLINALGIRSTFYVDNMFPDENAQLVAALLLDPLGAEVLGKIESIHNHKGVIDVKLKVMVAETGGLRYHAVINRACEEVNTLCGFSGTITDARNQQVYNR